MQMAMLLSVSLTPEENSATFLSNRENLTFWEKSPASDEGNKTDRKYNISVLLEISKNLWKAMFYLVMKHEIYHRRDIIEENVIIKRTNAFV